MVNVSEPRQSKGSGKNMSLGATFEKYVIFLDYHISINLFDTSSDVTKQCLTVNVFAKTLALLPKDLRPRDIVKLKKVKIQWNLLQEILIKLKKIQKK